jgi:hypothetical protein
MYQFMHHPYSLAGHEKEATELVVTRNLSPWTQLPALDPFGCQLMTETWRIEADQLVTLVERLQAMRKP